MYVIARNNNNVGRPAIFDTSIGTHSTTPAFLVVVVTIIIRRRSKYGNFGENTHTKGTRRIVFILRRGFQKNPSDSTARRTAPHPPGLVITVRTGRKKYRPTGSTAVRGDRRFFVFNSEYKPLSGKLESAALTDTEGPAVSRTMRTNRNDSSEHFNVFAPTFRYGS